jgi:hypothetical protein
MSAVDEFRLRSASVPDYSSPASDAEAITPSDDADLAAATRAIWVGGAGNVQVTMLGGQEVVFVGVQAGSLLPIRVVRVHEASTTATNLVGIY